MSKPNRRKAEDKPGKAGEMPGKAGERPGKALGKARRKAALDLFSILL